MQRNHEDSKHDDEGCFQSMREETLETVHFTPACNYSKEATGRRRSNEEQVAWKFKEVESAYRKKQQRFSKNISFEDQQPFSSMDCHSDQEEMQFSSLSSHYKPLQPFYRKHYSFGTNWIGKRQYFASNFVSTSILERPEAQYYNQPQLDQVPRSYSFDSNFESGNLLAAYRVGANEFDLLLQNDINTKGNTQWFYFCIFHPPKNTSIRLNIVNMRKPDSLFNYGMLPCLHSLQEERRNKKGWFRAGKDVRYFRNQHQIENSKRYYYTLSFTISTAHEEDVIRIAQSFPYTYSQLNEYLESVERIKYKQVLFERETIQNTIGRNRIQAVTIRESNPKAKTRPMIVVIARQHPGETPSSYICEGLIDFLLSKDKEGEFLRRNYEIKVLPMINPDGVCAGNYRTNLMGLDLNRRWQGSKAKNLHEAALTKKYIAEVTKGKEIAFMLDLHGHSRKMFSFFYGNPNPASPADARMFPLICSKLSPSYIRFEDCTFTAEEHKRNTARVQFGLAFRCSNIFTFEASFFGFCGKDREKRHFTVEDYRQLGTVLGRGIFAYERGKHLYETNQESKDIVLYKKCLFELRNNNVLIAVGEKVNSGSEQSPQECELKQNEELKLQLSEDYCKTSQTKSANVMRKVVKRQLMKWPVKSQRQMQVMDLAQVHSNLPNNILALIPNSFLAKKKTAETACKQVQADHITLRVNQEKKCSNAQSPPCLKKQHQERRAFSMTKSSILAVSRDQPTKERLLSAGFLRLGQRRSSSTKVIHKKTPSCSPHKPTASREIQTGQSSSLLLTKAKLEKDITIFELKAIEPSLASLVFPKAKEASFICKNASVSLFENGRIKLRGQA